MQQERFSLSNSSFPREGRKVTQEPEHCEALPVTTRRGRAAELPALLHLLATQVLGMPWRAPVKCTATCILPSLRWPNKPLKEVTAASHRAGHCSGSREDVGAKPLSKILRIVLAYLEFEFL